MGLLRYIGNILKLAFSPSFGRADTISGFAGAILYGADKLFKLEVIMGIDWWGLPLMILGAMVAMRLLLAPYWIYKDVNEKYDELKGQLGDKDKKRETREKLGEFMVEGQELKAKCGNEKEPPPNDEADEWADKVEHYLADELDDSFISRFRNSAGVPMAANSISSIPHRNLWSGIRIRLYQLEKFIEQLGD
ncbi:hypothetical protein ACFLTR_04195 [Chloroflexota bacterium]